MLTHPTLDKLYALRRKALAQAFEEQLRTPRYRGPLGRGALGAAHRPRARAGARPGVSRLDCATPSCAMARATKTSITATRVGWTSPGS
jgi:hypothetical protein